MASWNTNDLPENLSDVFPSDVKSCMLCHPMRAQKYLASMIALIEHAVGKREWDVLTAAFERDDFTLSNLPQLMEQHRLYQLSRFFETAAQAPGSTELGGGMATMVGIRHFVSPYRLFRLEDGLVELLGLTDMADDIPVEFLKLPFPRCYVELGTRRDLAAIVPNEVSGDHVLEGAYFETGTHPQRGRGVYILMTGSPLGKKDCMDDSTHAVFLSTNDPAQGLKAAMAEAFTHAVAQSVEGGYRVPHKENFDQALANLQWLVKALLYIGLPEARKTLALERTALLNQLAGLKSPGKKAKLSRRIQSASDVVWVHAPAVRSEPAAEGAGQGTVAAHWRRGHYRHQAHGPGYSLRKLIFIAPMRVGHFSGSEPLKTYVVR